MKEEMGEWKFFFLFLLTICTTFTDAARCTQDAPDRNLLCYQTRFTEQELDPCLCTHWVLPRELLDEKDYLLERNEDLQIILSVETGDTNLTAEISHEGVQGLELSTLWKKTPKQLVKYVKSIVEELQSSSDLIRSKRSFTGDDTDEYSSTISDDLTTVVTDSELELMKSTVNTATKSSSTASPIKSTTAPATSLVDVDTSDSSNDSAQDEAVQRPPLFMRLPSDAMYLAKHYDLKGLARYVDLFIINTHNIVESNHNVTYHPSRLMGINDINNADSLVDLITGLGIPKEKLVLSIPSHAYQFQLSNATVNLPQSPALGEPKLLTQAQLCKLTKKGNWTTERDEDLTAPYTFQNDTWIAFDDEMSASIKSKYIALSNLAGAAIMDIQDQDWSHYCDGEGEKGEAPGVVRTLYQTFTEVIRKPRQTQLLELQEQLHEHSMDAPTRVVRVVDHDGATHVVRRDVVVNFQCSRQGYFVHPTGCNRFYRCVKFNQYTDDWTVFEYDCPAGLAFDERWEVCVWPGSLPDGGACQGSSEIAPVPRNRFQCPSQPGYYADPENCRWFFACLDHSGDGVTPLTAYEFRCPFSLVFNEQTLVCDWPWNVQGCGSQGVGGARFTYGDILEGRNKPSYATIPDYLVSGGRIENNGGNGGSILGTYYGSNGVLDINAAGGYPSESQQIYGSKSYSGSKLSGAAGGVYSADRGSYTSSSSLNGNYAKFGGEGAYNQGSGAYAAGSGAYAAGSGAYAAGSGAYAAGSGAYAAGNGAYAAGSQGAYRQNTAHSAGAGGAYVQSGGSDAYSAGNEGQYVHGQYPGDSGDDGSYRDGKYSSGGQYVSSGNYGYKSGAEGSYSGSSSASGKYSGSNVAAGKYAASGVAGGSYFGESGQYVAGKGEQYSGSDESGSYEATSGEEFSANGPGKYYGAAAGFNSAVPSSTPYAGLSGQYDASKYSAGSGASGYYSGSSGQYSGVKTYPGAPVVSTTAVPFLSTQSGQYGASSGQYGGSSGQYSGSSGQYSGSSSQYSGSSGQYSGAQVYTGAPVVSTTATPFVSTQGVQYSTSGPSQYSGSSGQYSGSSGQYSGSSGQYSGAKVYTGAPVVSTTATPFVSTQGVQYSASGPSQYSGASGQYSGAKQYSTTVSPFLSTQAGQYTLSNGLTYSGPSVVPNFSTAKSVLHHAGSADSHSSTASTTAAPYSPTPSYTGVGGVYSGVSLSGERFGVDGESGHIHSPATKVLTGFEQYTGGADNLAYQVNSLQPSLSANVDGSGYSTSGKVFFSPTPTPGGFSSYTPSSYSTPAPNPFYGSSTSLPSSYSSPALNSFYGSSASLPGSFSRLPQSYSTTPAPVQYSTFSPAKSTAFTTASPPVVSYSTPKPAAYNGVSYSTTPAPSSPSVVSYSSTPAPYSPSVASYSASPASYSPSPVPYSPSVGSYSASPAPYSPSPAPYSPSVGSYSPSIASYSASPAHYAPSPAPYSPSGGSYSASPAPYSPSPAPYSPSVGSYSASPAPYSPSPAPYSPSPIPYAPSAGPVSFVTYQSPKPVAYTPSTVAPSVVSYSTPAPKTYYPTSTPAPNVQYSSIVPPVYSGSLTGFSGHSQYTGNSQYNVGQGYSTGESKQYSGSYSSGNSAVHSAAGNVGYGYKSPISYSTTEKASYASPSVAPIAYSTTVSPVNTYSSGSNVYSSGASGRKIVNSQIYSQNSFSGSQGGYSGDDYLPPLETAAVQEYVKKPCDHPAPLPSASYVSGPSIPSQTYNSGYENGKYQTPSYVFETSSPAPIYNPGSSLYAKPIIVQPLPEVSSFKDYFYSSVLPSSYSTPAPIAYSTTPVYSTTPEYQSVSSYSTPKPIVSTVSPIYESSYVSSTYSTPKPVTYSPSPAFSTTSRPIVNYSFGSSYTPRPVTYSSTPFVSTTAAPIVYSTTPKPVSYAAFESSKIYPTGPSIPVSFASYSSPPVVYGPGNLQPIKSYQSTGSYDVQSYTATPKPCASNALDIADESKASGAADLPDGTYVVGIKHQDKVVIVSRLSDFNPLVVEKLGATCDCHSQSQPIKVVRRRKILKSTTASPNEEDLGSSGQYNSNSIQSYNAHKIETASPSVDVVSYNTQQESEQSERFHTSPKVTSKKLYSAKKSSVTSTTEKSYDNDEDEHSHDDKLSITEFGTIECKRAGLFRHPKHCNKFYQCNWDEWKKKFTLHEFKCPIHLAYDSNIGACNWPSKGPACSNDNLLV